MAPQPPANTSHLRSKPNQNEKKRDKKESTKVSTNHKAPAKEENTRQEQKTGKTATLPRVQESTRKHLPPTFASLCIGG
jgi:hypothetical protein